MKKFIAAVVCGTMVMFGTSAYASMTDKERQVVADAFGEVGKHVGENAGKIDALIKIIKQLIEANNYNLEAIDDLTRQVRDLENKIMYFHSI